LVAVEGCEINIKGKYFLIILLLINKLIKNIFFLDAWGKTALQ